MNDARLGIQLYSVRDDCKKDFRGTLQALADMGYDGVEFAWNYGGMSPRDLVRFLQKLGLQTAGLHVSLEEILNPASDSYAYARALNSPFITTSLAGEVASNWLPTLDRMLQAGAVAHSQGFIFTYHHHAEEFASVNGASALDLAMARPSLFQFELDTHWIKKGGQDPVSMLRRYAGRAPQVHIKDWAANGSFVEVGKGLLDVPGVVCAAIEGGARWLIVEQDQTAGSAVQSAKVSIETLKKCGIGRR